MPVTSHDSQKRSHMLHMGDPALSQPGEAASLVSHHRLYSVSQASRQLPPIPGPSHALGSRCPTPAPLGSVNPHYSSRAQATPSLVPRQVGLQRAPQHPVLLHLVSHCNYVHKCDYLPGRHLPPSTPQLGSKFQGGNYCVPWTKRNE